MSYACMRSFHYLLIIIRVDLGKVYIMDPLDKNLEEYNRMIYMLERQLQSLSHYISLYRSFPDKIIITDVGKSSS
jgi:hypothetical protein